MEWTTTQIVALVASSSVVAAIFTQGLSWFREWWKRRYEASYSALYLALALESYASSCSSVISESETYESSGEHAGSPKGNVAELPDFPADIEWKTMGIASTTAALSFRVEIDTTRAMLSGWWEFDDEDVIVPAVRLESARLGNKALELAAELRSSRGIESVKYNDKEWNVAVYLADSLTKYTKLQLEREKANAEMHKRMLESVQQHKESMLPPV